MYQNLWCFIFHRLEEGDLHSCTLWSLQSFHQFSVEGQLWGCAFYQWLQPLFERLLFSFVLCLVSSLLLKPQMELKPSTSHCHLILLPHLNHLLLHQSLTNQSSSLSTSFTGAAESKFGPILCLNIIAKDHSLSFLLISVQLLHSSQ